MSRKSLVSIIAFVLLCTVTAAAYEGQDLVGEYCIPVGIPVIDGNISPGEWDHANWLQLDKLYYGDPNDLSDANWAALWSPETNLIYVVIRGIDTEHVFGDGYWGKDDWNKYDIAEVYFDPSNSDVNPYQQIQDPAQQWMSGNDTNDGRWIMLPVEWVFTDNPLSDDLRPEFFSTIKGDEYIYEYALTPYEAFGWNTGRLDKILQLETDMRVGMDVIMSSKSTSFGMLCENAWEADDDLNGDEIADGVITITKWNYADRFLDHSLIKDPNQAWRPRPGNKEVDVSSEVTLKWNPGKNAASHDIYFGTSFEDVNSATDPDLLPVGRGNQPLEENTYGPNEVPLALDGTYYWRIDEVSGPTVTKGNVWRFTVTNFLIVDDFDSYASTEEIRGDDTIDPVWADYWTNYTCAELALETITVRDGNSILYKYDNSSYPQYSEIEASVDDLLVTPDWTSYAARALTLWFYGAGDNDAEQMYLALEDQDANLAVVPYGGDANDLKNPRWQQWDIDLQEFNDINEVDLSNIAKIYIGFGDRFAPSYGGSGEVYFDDIRLYLQRCITEYVDVDFTGDCFVNLDDLEIIARDWLQSDYYVDINEPTGELIWYMLDHDGTNNTAVDSSGNGHDGFVSDAVWTTEGYIDGALIFDRDEESSVEVPPKALSSVTTQITIALWQYGNPDIQPFEDNLFQGERMYGIDPIRVLNVHLPSVDSVVYWDAGNPNDVWSPEVWRECERIQKEAEFDDFAGQWNHWTFVKNCDANDSAGVMKMYLNGALFHIGYDVNVPLAGTIDDFTGTIDNFKIGSGPDSSYSGTIDDFRIYNYELSQDQIDYLATAGSGYYPLQQRTANAYEDESIDFRDYAEMADNWMKEMLWPQ
jgi:hypothetical protein